MYCSQKSRCGSAVELAAIQSRHRNNNPKTKVHQSGNYLCDNFVTEAYYQGTAKLTVKMHGYNGSYSSKYSLAITRQLKVFMTVIMA